MAISKSTWQELFSLAIQFKQLTPWDWVTEQEVFGVKNPETGEIAYCTILGNGGEFFGIGMYVGTEGLNSLFELASGLITDPMQAALSQRCLMLSFGDKEDLMETDEKVYKMLNMKFKGKSAFPLFHDYTPGFFPWTIDTEAQATMIKYVLSRAIIMCQACADDPYFFTPETEDEDEELYRVAIATKKGAEWEWDYEWITPPEIEDEELPEIEISQIYLKSQLSNLPKNATKVWIMDIFQAPAPAQEDEKERPFFPKVLVIIDPESGLMLGNEMYKLGEIEAEFQKAFVKYCKEQKYIPNRITCGNEDTYEFVEAIGDAMGIETEIDEEVGEYLTEFKTFLYDEMDEDE